VYKNQERTDEKKKPLQTEAGDEVKEIGPRKQKKIKKRGTSVMVRIHNRHAQMKVENRPARGQIGSMPPKNVLEKKKKKAKKSAHHTYKTEHEVKKKESQKGAGARKVRTERSQQKKKKEGE